MLAEVKYLNSDEHHSVFPVSQKACDFRLKDLELQARVFSSHLMICHVRINQVLQQLSRDKVELSEQQISSNSMVEKYDRKDSLDLLEYVARSEGEPGLVADEEYLIKHGTLKSTLG